MILLLFALVADDPATDPIGPALEGRLQCYRPDTVRRTCEALAGYTLEPDGRILNQAQVLLTADPPLIMRTVTVVTVRDGAICGRREGLETSTFTLNGRQLDQETTDNLRRRMAARVEGVETCTRYVERDGVLWADPVTDGVPQESHQVLWVSPAEGYAIGPRTPELRREP